MNNEPITANSIYRLLGSAGSGGAEGRKIGRSQSSWRNRILHDDPFREDIHCLIMRGACGPGKPGCGKRALRVFETTSCRLNWGSSQGRKPANSIEELVSSTGNSRIRPQLNSWENRKASATTCGKVDQLE